MGRNVFDRVAGDYEKIHDRSLPPGVHSHEFIQQRAANVIRWIGDGYFGQEFCYLDFGCGNGRLFKPLALTKTRSAGPCRSSRLPLPRSGSSPASR